MGKGKRETERKNFIRIEFEKTLFEFEVWLCVVESVLGFALLPKKASKKSRALFIRVAVKFATHKTTTID